MRKFYSIIVVMVAALVGFSAQANKTITFKANMDGVVSVRNPQNQYESEAVTVAGTTITVGDSDTCPIQCNSGYMMTVIKSGETQFNSESNPTNSTTVSAYPLADGSVVEITVVDESSVPKKEFTLTGTPGSYYISFNYETIYPDSNGKITRTYESYSSISVYPTSDYKLLNVTEQGGSVFSADNGYAYVYCGNFASMTPVLEVNTINKADIDTGKFTVNVDGNVNKFYMYDSSYNYTYFNDASTVVTFEEGSSYTFSSQYGALYQIKVNGDVVASGWNSYRYTPANGDVVTVETEYPDINVAVNFSFTGTADAGVIKELRYDNSLLDASEWNSGSWNGKYGKTIVMTLNTSDYMNVAAKINGTAVTPDYYGNINLTLSEESYNIEIYGERTQPYKVTIVVADPATINIFKGYTQETYTLSGEETEIEVSRSNNGLQFKPAEGYVLNGITVDGNAPASDKFYSNTYYVEGNCIIEVDVEKINRDKIAVVYLENLNWEYKSFVLSQSNYDLRKEVEIANGYNFVEYGDFDIPFSISGYPQPTVYLNDEEIESIYGSYPALSEYKEGDVIKMYGSSQTPYELNYTIAENAKVTVMHDHLTEVANPANHNVLPGTQVHIIPVATFANESSNTIDVTVNDVKLNPDADGRYSFVVNANTNVDVKNGSSGIENVEIDNNAANQAVYNLQGIKVADSLKDLPAGLYIQSGKKVLVK